MDGDGLVIKLFKKSELTHILTLSHTHTLNNAMDQIRVAFLFKTIQNEKNLIHNSIDLCKEKHFNRGGKHIF